MSPAGAIWPARRAARPKDRRRPLLEYDRARRSGAEPEKNPPPSPATMWASAGPDTDHAIATASRHVSPKLTSPAMSFRLLAAARMQGDIPRFVIASSRVCDRSSETRSRPGRGRFWPRRRRSARAPVPPRERRSGDGPRSGGALLPLSRRRRRPAPVRRREQGRRAPAIEMEPGP